MTEYGLFVDPPGLLVVPSASSVTSVIQWVDDRMANRTHLLDSA